MNKFYSHNDPEKIYEDAIKCISSIRSYSIDRNYPSEKYISTVDRLSGHIIELAKDGEFSLVESLSKQTVSLLSQDELLSKSAMHSLSTDDFIHHIFTFPTNPWVLINHVTDDFDVNLMIARSTCKTVTTNGFKDRDDYFRLLCEFAKFGDIESWEKLSLCLHKQAGQFESVYRSLCFFDSAVLAEKKSRLSLVNDLSQHYDPKSISIDYVEKTDSMIPICDALLEIDCYALINKILTRSAPLYDCESPIQMFIEKYKFNPGEDYLKNVAKHVININSRNTKLADSYYIYLLNNGFDCHPGAINMSAGICSDILEKWSSNHQDKSDFIIENSGIFVDKVVDGMVLIKKQSISSAINIIDKVVSINFLRYSNTYMGEKLSNSLGL